VDARELAGHSLRRGGATAAARAGKTEATIMQQTGHRSVTMVRKYITEAERWKDNAASGIGL
jgi:integrase